MFLKALDSIKTIVTPKAVFSFHCVLLEDVECGLGNGASYFMFTSSKNLRHIKRLKSQWSDGAHFRKTREVP